MPHSQGLQKFWHTPPMQASKPKSLHTSPHATQFHKSVMRLTQVSPQSVNPGTQGGSPQIPSRQYGAVSGQTVPQPPQLLRSDHGSTHTPPQRIYGQLQQPTRISKNDDPARCLPPIST
jgi:hypothetical protein